MNPKRFCIAAIALAALVGCQKKADTAGTPAAPKPTTVELVKDNERSRNFLAVNKHLELGGTLYGYVDVDGDVLKLTGNLQGMLTRISAMQPQLAPYAKQDFGALATSLGLTDIKALGPGILTITEQIGRVLAEADTANGLPLQKLDEPRFPAGVGGCGHGGGALRALV